MIKETHRYSVTKTDYNRLCEIARDFGHTGAGSISALLRILANRRWSIILNPGESQEDISKNT